MLPHMTRRPAAALSGGCGVEQALDAHGVDRPAAAIAQRHGRLPPEQDARQRDVGLSRSCPRASPGPPPEKFVAEVRIEESGSACDQRGGHARSAGMLPCALHPQINERARSSFQSHVSAAGQKVGEAASCLTGRAAAHQGACLTTMPA
jgi:hypothetical protein